MAKAQPGGKGKALVVRSKKVFALPTGTLHYAQLTKPDEDYNKFSASIIFTPEELDAAAEVIQERCIDFLREEWDETAPKNAPAPMAAKTWLENRLKETKDGTAKFLRFDTRAEFEYNGETIHKTMSAWDAKNTRLDLPSLRLGRGSRVQVVLKPGLTMGGKGPEVPSPTLELVGVRIIKLVQFTAGGLQDAVDEADLAEADDLSAYAGGKNKPVAKEADDTPEGDDPF